VPTRQNVSKDWIAVARKNVKRARDLPFNPDMLIYGRKKKGKTTFALSGGVEKTLVLDPEEGAWYKHKLNPYIWPINKWEDMNDAYNALRTGKLSPATLGQGPEKEPFRIVVPDGLTKINNICLKYIMRTEEQRNLDRRPGIIDRRDYNKSGELMKQMLDNFHSLPMSVIWTAQERMITGGTGDDDEDSEDVEAFYVPDLPQGVRGHVNALVDIIARIYTVRKEIKGEQRTLRRLQIGVHERYDTGARTEYELPEIIKVPTVPKTIQLMREGIK
jgi:hypothetical protein